MVCLRLPICTHTRYLTYVTFTLKYVPPQKYQPPPNFIAGSRSCRAVHTEARAQGSGARQFLPERNTSLAQQPDRAKLEKSATEPEQGDASGATTLGRREASAPHRPAHPHHVPRQLAAPAAPPLRKAPTPAPSPLPSQPPSQSGEPPRATQARLVPVHDAVQRGSEVVSLSGGVGRASAKFHRVADELSLGQCSAASLAGNLSADRVSNFILKRP